MAAPAVIDRNHLDVLEARENERFVAERPMSMALLERSRRTMPRGVPVTWMDDLYEHPPVFVAHGHGATITDVEQVIHEPERIEPHRLGCLTHRHVVDPACRLPIHVALTLGQDDAQLGDARVRVRHGHQRPHARSGAGDEGSPTGVERGYLDHDG